ncbi:isochorismatase family protein [Nocardioides aurantiacus]|uniref:Nicotinamidase-related amidase n=1 Tax=Nocardioides aurantiacus TaxID=86796 RepID=A0A3N2CPY4_9ACTN|nr:isochorismatase family protein [Nocardioides aurantiacus]ROR89384.1 nicotinamidase-related amidase [Nocardioides aurantiacus]
MTTPRRALVVVDVQNEYFDGPLQVQHPPREVTLANITRAMDAAVELGLPVVVLQHELPEGAPVFAVGSHGWSLHPEVERRLRPEFQRASKSFGSAFSGDGVADWLQEQEVDTITVVGYMTNNCDIATAVDAETRGVAAEVLADASGAIHLANDAGSASAQQVHETLMVLLHSNFAAVADTDAWVAAARAGDPLPKSDLGTSAVQGRARYGG